MSDTTTSSDQDDTTPEPECPITALAGSASLGAPVVIRDDRDDEDPDDD